MSFLVKTLLGDNVVHPVARGGAAAPAPAPQQDEEADEAKQRVPTRTLILRVQSCTVAQDRRDALAELRASPDLPYVMAAKEVSYLCNVLRSFPEDSEVVESSLAVLSGITDLASYPAVSANYAVSEKEKRRIRDSFLHELVPEVPLFLSHVKAGVFWTRFHAVQMLQRLQEYDPSAVHKLLLSSHGIGVLLDILNDSNHGGALRNEGLVLITSITATDTELQTLLAFDNAFETLFVVIKEEGGLDGGVIVSDCLTIAHNMLRDNKATQKLFREMGCARLVCTLLEAVPDRVRAARHHTASLKNQSADAGENVENNFTPLSSTQNDVIFKAVSILSCLLRGAETHQEGPAAQEALLQSGALGPLSSVALGGVLVDDAARVEALRTLAVLLRDRRVGIEEFMQLQVVTLLCREPPLRVEEWPALRAILHVLLGIEDRVMQSAAAHVLHALLSVSSSEGELARRLLKGFAPPLPSSAPPSAAARALRNALPADCGAAMAIAIFGSIPCSRSSQKYYSALLLDRLLGVPGSVEKLLAMGQREAVTSSQMQHSAASSATNSVFLAYAQYVINCLRGHGEMDLNTLSACFRALLRWVLGCEQAARLLVGDGTYYKSLLQRAGQEDGPVHVRFWSAALCAAVCLAAPRDAPDAVQDHPSDANRLRMGGSGVGAESLPPSSLLDRRHLLELFFNHLGGPAVFDSFLFDVKASSPMWAEPPKDAFLRPTPALYDEKMKNTLLGVVKQFNDICPLRGRVQPGPLQEGTLSAATNTATAVFNPALGDVDIFSEGPSPSTVDPSAAFGAAAAAAATPGQQQLLQVGAPGSAVEEVRISLQNAYESRVKELVEANDALQRELQLVREQLHADADAQALGRERESRHLEEVASLRENIRLLEEALSAEEEEHRLLAQSLNMLEEQLREARANPTSTTEVFELRREVQKLTEERDRLLVLVAELDEEKTPATTYPGRRTTYPSPSPPPLPPPSAPPSLFSAKRALQPFGEGEGAFALPATPHCVGVAEGTRLTPEACPQSSSQTTGPNGFQASSSSLQPSQQQQEQEPQPRRRESQPVAEPFGRSMETVNGMHASAAAVPAAERNLFPADSSEECVRGNDVGARRTEAAPVAGAARTAAPLNFNPFANMAGAHNDPAGDPW
ncbi:uncharacterized protein Tco025E_08218 [Trypanosoma conorhini]|uniref:Vesicle tethering protein Uso1/P115-like head domain-containing protein n=1 Tax=Trypanosoma conorhini TaxID=83891 RepID=A0A422NCQ4_9TRYP|nr:uncharacterized protein Tco025E_08218 [Trypanosoma conorhini]RNF03251.1 hypothetical protein Tco025E_08218 [Trypanosoma conorhini]